MVEVQHTHDATGTQQHTVPRLRVLSALAGVDAGPLAEMWANQRYVLRHMCNTASVLPDLAHLHTALQDDQF
jgi:pyrroline-5-carboxylate reductase